MRPFFAISVFGKCEVRTAVLTRQCRVCVTAPAGIICDKFPGTDTGAPPPSPPSRGVLCLPMYVPNKVLLGKVVVQ